MSNYEKIVKAMRHCSKNGVVKCEECDYCGKEWPVGCMEAMMRDAADAIEALQALSETLHQHIQDLNGAFRIESEARQKAEAAIEELKILLKEADKKQAYQHDYICELVAEVEGLKAAQLHWVSVKHPPTEGRRYWVWDVDGFCYCDTWRCGKWELADAMPDTKITHWMPLPEPPLPEPPKEDA